MISPEMFREFMVPCYQRFTSFLREHGVKWIFVDSDGDASLLLPLWLEAGINGFLPIEVAAGMDPRTIRKQYGRNLRLMGGLDKRTLLQSQAAVDRELESKVPELVAEGGYVPHLDHVIQWECPLEAYQYYRRRLNELTLS
jgi:uroporphyrinogen decarboxylase